VCKVEEPQLTSIDTGHQVACHFSLKQGETLIDVATRMGRSVVTTNADT
jgi:hypothetical protein